MEEQAQKYNTIIRDHLRNSYLLSDEKIEAVMPRFLETITTLMTELEQLVANGQAEALCRAGHAMKGALLNLGLHDLAQKAFCIEKHQEQSQTEIECRQLVAELRQEISKIL